MSSLKQLKVEQKNIARQQEVILELNALAKDIERSEKIISTLNSELQAVNTKYQGPRDTRQDVAYLTGLLECAKKKLAWEKQIASLQKRTPALMEKITGVMNDPSGPPPQEVCEQMHRALSLIQASMKRLEGAREGAKGD